MAKNRQAAATSSSSKASDTPHSATPPGAGFDLVEPELEDVYFSTMAGHYGGRGEQPVLEAAR